MPKLKHNELPGYRDAQLAQQDGLCALCGAVIEDDPVLDHDHVSGRVRAVVHRGCNRAEGVARHALRWVKGGTPEFLRKAADYMEQSWDHAPHHPTHKTEQDKRLKLLRKRLVAAKTITARRRLEKEIKALAQSIAQNDKENSH